MNNPKLGLIIVAAFFCLVSVICCHVLSKPDDKPCSYVLPPKYKIVYDTSIDKYGVWRKDLPRTTSAVYVFSDSCVAIKFLNDIDKYH